MRTLKGQTAIADHLGVTTKTIQRWTKTDPTFRAILRRVIGGQYQCEKRALDAWVAARTKVL